MHELNTVDCMATATDEGDIVKAVIEEVRERLGKGDALAIALEKAGYAGKVSSRYSASVVSSWVTGRAMPGADVFLAVVRLVAELPGGPISLDSLLYEEGNTTDRKERQRLAEMKRDLTVLEQRLVAVERMGERMGGQLDYLIKSLDTLAAVVAAENTIE